MNASHPISSKATEHERNPTAPTRLLDRDGFEIAAKVVGDDAVDRLLRATDAPAEADARGRGPGGVVYAMRNLLAVPRMRELAASAPIRRIVEAALGDRAECVRGIFFDKTPGANWKVAWHQDRSIAVKQRVPLDGYGPWSTKAGVVHVQPPRAILEAMLTIRLHLDDCGEENGPLKVIPGSQQCGMLTAEEVEATVQRGAVVTCVVPRGGAVVMRPLILHASSPARSPSHRRVIHLEFCGTPLPPGLEWAFTNEPEGDE